MRTTLSRNRLRTGIAFATLFATFLSSGCATPGILSLARWKHSFPKANRKNPAVRALCLWQPGEGRGLDDMPTRGFTGQIYFFARNGASPVVVNGDLRIFVFDDQGTDEEQSKPFHQFDFKGKAWQNFLTDSQIGPGYSLFIPYTRKGHHHAQCAIQVRLIADGGPTIYSDMVHITLSGAKKTAERRNEEDTKIANDRSKTRVDSIDLQGRSHSGRNPAPYPVAGRNQADRNSRSAVSAATIQEFTENMHAINNSPRQFVGQNSRPIRDYPPRMDAGNDRPQNSHPLVDDRDDDVTRRSDREINTSRRIRRFRLHRSEKATSADSGQKQLNRDETFDNRVGQVFEPAKDFVGKIDQLALHPAASDNRFDTRREMDGSTRMPTQSVHALRSSDDGW